MRAHTQREGAWPHPELAPADTRAGLSQQQAEVGEGLTTRRLTLVIFSLAAGGAERVMSALANAWSDEGRTVTLITLAGQMEDFYPLRPAVRRVALNLAFPSRNRFERVWSTGRRVYHLRHAIRASRPDAVISFLDVINNLTLLATRGERTRVIVSERTDPTRSGLGSGSALLRRVLYPLADSVVVQSDSIRRWAETFVPADQVRVIPNPLGRVVFPGGDDRDGPLPHGSSRNERDRMVLAMGRLGHEKGFDLLLRAFARLSGEHPGWSLCILGEGQERAALEKLAAELGIERVVRMPGLLRDPAPLLRRAGLFVLPSRFEGFPNALLEAMACGVPVIAADCPSGPRHIVRNGIDGVLVQPEDVEALASAMDRLIRDPRTRTVLGSRAVSVRERFGIDAVMHSWNELLTQVVGRTE